MPADVEVRRMPMGAEVAERGVHFRVWAPGRTSVDVMLDEHPHPLAPEEGGYFSGSIAEARAGSLYKYRLDGGDSFPDPASRYQPEGPHGPSEVIDPDAFQWTDDAWPGVSIGRQIIYELHIGTFTREGTFDSAARELPKLAELGVTVLEIMPLAEFTGSFGWGYDGVDLFAPYHHYGRPADLRKFVDTAHALGMGVILDVVYNHLGADGNYLSQFTPHYFSNKYTTDWGDAINFDNRHSGPVREFFRANSAYWISEFHMDGLRLDATQNIYDDAEPHILAEIVRSVREAAGPRSTIVVGENEPQETRLLRKPEEGGYGLDALWNDDLHHTAIVALTGHNDAYYTDYLGSPQEFVSAAKYGYLYQGQWYKWQKQRRGRPSLGLPPSAFVNFLENHDQVANSARGLRIHKETTPGRLKAMTAWMLLGPGTPMLFQGQEFAASSPFRYFADVPGELCDLVRAGRKEFLSQWRSMRMPEMLNRLDDPCSRAVFERCKLDHSERERNSEIYALHRDLLKLRREDPVLGAWRSGEYDGAVLGPQAFVMRVFGSTEDRLIVVNLGLDLHLNPAPEPLLAPPGACDWQILFSTENPAYGGCGTAPLDTPENWRIPGHATVVLKPVARKKTTSKEENE